MEALQPLGEHRPVTLVAQAPCDVDDSAGIDPEQVAVVGEVMDRAKSQAVDDGGDPLGRGVGDDVSRLDELTFSQGANRAAVLVGAQDVEPKPLLVQPHPDLAERIPAGIRCRNRPARLRVGQGHAHLEQHDAIAGIVLAYEDRRDHDVLAGGHPVEVDERSLEGVCRL
jgi:hypothetical protein